jgi:hypothetical protein
MIDAPLVQFTAKLLAAERRRRGTPGQQGADLLLGGGPGASLWAFR